MGDFPASHVWLGKDTHFFALDVDSSRKLASAPGVRGSHGQFRMKITVLGQASQFAGRSQNRTIQRQSQWRHSVCHWGYSNLNNLTFCCTFMVGYISPIISDLGMLTRYGSFCVIRTYYMWNTTAAGWLLQFLLGQLQRWNLIRYVCIYIYMYIYILYRSV